jgi:hypothetical protein
MPTATTPKKSATTTKTTTAQARAPAAAQSLWSGQWISEHYSLIRTNNQVGFDVQIQQFDDGSGQPTKSQLLSQLCPQAMRVLSQIFAQYGVLGSNANVAPAMSASSGSSAKVSGTAVKRSSSSS